MTSSSSSAQCAPRFTTRRRYERPTWGPYWGRVAAGLGRPYMPWQQHVADIAGEVLPSGRLAYREVVVTVPRQSGKTTLVLSIVVGRAEAGDPFGGRQTMLYAAQTGTAAYDKWKKEYVEDLRAAKKMRGRFTTRMGKSDAAFTFNSSRSTFGPIPTQSDSGHGPVLDFGALDEAFAQKDSRVEGAWSPAMITRPMAQLMILSTAGDATSTYFRGKVDQGRLNTLADIDYGTAYVEYSAPDDADPDDHDVWWRCMPALGYTQNIESIQIEYNKMKLADFKRAFLNIWVDRVSDQVIPADLWDARKIPEGVERKTRPVFALDISADRTHAVIAMGAAAPDGTPIVRLIKRAPGTGWVVDELLRLREQYDPAAIVMDGVGPVGSLKVDLEREWVDVHTMTASEMAHACGGFYDAVTRPDDAGRRLWHYDEQPLRDALAGAEKRDLADAWAWTRRKSFEATRADISPLVAVTVAHWAQIKFGDDPTETGSPFG
jgi:hypothetical protein